MPFPIVEEFSWLLQPEGAPPPLSGYLRFDDVLTAATSVAISNTDLNSRDATSALAAAFTAAGIRFKVLDVGLNFPDAWQIYETTGVIADQGAYQTLGIEWISSGPEPTMNSGDEVRVFALAPPSPTPPSSIGAYAVRVTLSVHDANDQKRVTSSSELASVNSRIVVVPAGETVSSVLSDAAIASGCVALNSDVEGVTWMPVADGFDSPEPEELRPWAFAEGDVWGGNESPAVTLTNPTDRDAEVEVVWGAS